MTPEHEPGHQPGDEPDRAPDDDIESLLGAHALDALDDEERREVDAYLAETPSARTEAARLAMAVDALAAAASAHAAEPSRSDPTALDATDVERAAMEPAALERAWERVRAEMPTGRAASAERSPLPPLQLPTRPPAAPLPPGAAAAPADQHQGDVIPLDRRRRLRAWMVAVAAAAALVVGLVLGVTLTREDPAGQLSLEQLAAEASEGAGSRSGTLSGDAVGEVKAVVAADGSGFLYADALPALPAGRTYQMWSLDGTEPVSLGVLGADPGLVVFPAGTATTLAISEEPAAGSVAPTGTPVASGMLTGR